MQDTPGNTGILKEAYANWHNTKGRSVDHWLSIMGDTIDFRSFADGEGGLNFSRRVESRDDMKRYFGKLTQGMEMIHHTVDRYVEQGDTVVAVATTSWRVRSAGKTFETLKVDVFRFENGKIVSVFEYYDTAKIMAANTRCGVFTKGSAGRA